MAPTSNPIDTKLNEMDTPSITQAPDCTRILCNIGGFLIFVYGICWAIQVVDIIEDPVLYLIGIAQILFGIVTMVLESSEETAQQYVIIKRLQRGLHEMAKFVVLLPGRGAFYIYVGAHIIYIRHSILGLLLGIYVVAMGVIYLAWNWNVDLTKPVAPVVDKLGAVLAKVRSCLPGGRKSTVEDVDQGQGHYMRVGP